MWLRWDGGSVGSTGRAVAVLMVRRGGGVFSSGGMCRALVVKDGHVLAPFWSLCVVRGGGAGWRGHRGRCETVSCGQGNGVTGGGGDLGSTPHYRPGQSPLPKGSTGVAAPRYRPGCGWVRVAGVGQWMWYSLCPTGHRPL